MKNRLFKKVLAGIAALAMVATMMPGMAQKTVAADKIVTITSTPLSPLTATVKAYPTTNVKNALKTPWTLPDADGTTWNVTKNGNLKVVLLPTDYYEYANKAAASNVILDPAQHDSTPGNPWVDGYSGGTGQEITDNKDDLSGRSYILTIDADALETGTLDIQPSRATPLKVYVTVKTGEGINASQTTVAPHTTSSFKERTWVVTFNPTQVNANGGTGVYEVSDGNNSDQVTLPGTVHNTSLDYSSEISVYADNKNTRDFEMNIASTYGEEPAEDDYVSYKSSDHGGNLVDVIDKSSTGWATLTEQLKGQTKALAGFKSGADTDTTSYVGIYRMNDQLADSTTTVDWLTPATVTNMAAVTGKANLPDTIKKNVTFTINPEDIYRLYVWGPSNTNDEDNADKNTETIANDGATRQGKADATKRYMAYKHVYIYLGKVAPGNAEIKIQNGDELTGSDKGSVANIYSYQYVIRDKDGNRFDMPEDLQHNYDYYSADPIEYPFDDVADAIKNTEARRWYQADDNEVYWDTYKEGETFEFTVKVDPMYDGSKMEVIAIGNDDETTAGGAGGSPEVIPYDEATGTYKFKIGENSPYRIVARNIKRAKTGIVRNIPQSDAIFDKMATTSTVTGHTENRDWVNKFYGYSPFSSYSNETNNCNVANPRYQWFVPANEADDVMFDLLAFATPGAVGTNVEWNGHVFPVGEHTFKIRLSDSLINAPGGNANIPMADGNGRHGTFDDDANNDRYALGKVTVNNEEVKVSEDNTITFTVEEDKTYDIRVEDVKRKYYVYAPNLAAYDIEANVPMEREGLDGGTSTGQANNFRSSVTEGELYRFKINAAEGTQKGPDFKVMLRAAGDEQDNTNSFVPTEIKEGADGWYQFTVNNDTEIIIYGLSGEGFSDTANRTAEEQEAINWLKDQGVVNGYDDGSFRPGTSTTRAEFVKMLYQLKKGTEGTASFSDTANHWAAAQIGWASGQSIVNGYPDGTFKPNQSITRAEVAQVIWKLAGSQGTSFTATFPDVSQTAWYAKAVNWNFEKSIVKGFENGTFGPNSPIERAHMALILYRSYGQF